MPWPQTDTTNYIAQLGLPNKGRAIKELFVCNDWDLEPLDLLNGQALCCIENFNFENNIYRNIAV